MNITSYTNGNTVILEVVGRLTIGRGDAQLREAIDEAIEGGARSLVIDASKVTLLDSSGAGELVAAHRRMTDLGGRLAIAQISPKVGGVLVATRLTGLLELHDSVEGALLQVAA